MTYALAQVVVGDVLKRLVKQERPNGYIGVLAKTAKTSPGEQGDVKEEGSVLWYATDD